MTEFVLMSGGVPMVQRAGPSLAAEATQTTPYLSMTFGDIRVNDALLD